VKVGTGDCITSLLNPYWGKGKIPFPVEGLIEGIDPGDLQKGPGTSVPEVGGRGGRASKAVFKSKAEGLERTISNKGERRIKEREE